VLEPPSDLLWQRLRDGLHCTPADLRRARRRVKQLARDLPAFDSVWIDALVQEGRVTPYQARILESDATASVKLGEHILCDELGHGSHSTTWLARRGRSGMQVVLKRLQLPHEQQASVLAGARQLIAHVESVRHPCLVPPRECLADESGLLLVSPYVPGLPLSELLVRRGRFPAEVVTALARQLVDGLSVWHRAGLVHGDLRRSHVRITEQGTAVLVEAGLRPLRPADITVHAPLALEAYDGIARELIGVGRTATPATDWYALGCVLWQLLAGRPPFPMADPLAKLAAHQTRTADDVREWAPDTPDLLADLVRGLTHAEPQQRLNAVDEFRQRAGAPTRRDRRAIASFRRAFDAAVPHLRTARPRDLYRWPLALGAGCAGAVLAAVLADAGLRAELLSVAAKWSLSSKVNPEATAVSFSADLLPLPAPIPDGTILLTEPGPYAVATIKFPGTVTLRAAEGVQPELLVRDQPLRVAAEQWVCEGVRFRYDRMFHQGEPARTVVEVVARRIEWRRCTLNLGEPPRKSPDTPTLVGLHWRSPEDFSLGELRLENCLMHGDGVMVERADMDCQFALHNVLHLGRGPLLSLAATDVVQGLSLELRQVTLRESGPLVRLTLADPTQTPQVTVTADDCVLQPRSGQAVWEYVSTAPPALGPESLVWSGEGSLLAPNIPWLLWVNAGSLAREALDADDITLDGLAVGQVRFAGPATTDPHDSLVLEAETPRRSTEPPGIAPGEFSTLR
jgi:hypothetical protein